MSTYISLGTLAVAIMVAAITFQQAQTNRLRLRHELFERRFELFKIVHVYCSKIVQHAKVPDDQIPKIFDAMQRSRFLFGREIELYIDEIRKRSIAMMTANSQMKSPETQEKRLEAVEEFHDHLKYISEQTPRMFDIFKPYMEFPIK